MLQNYRCLRYVSKYCHRKVYQPLVFLAGGVGVTPFISMIAAMAAAGSTREVWLFYGIRDRGDLAFQAANSLVDGVEAMLNGVVSRINGFIGGINQGLEALGSEIFSAPDDTGAAFFIPTGGM